MKKVLILGGGYAGLSAARRLRKHDFDVTLIDRRDSHEALPLLPDVIGRALRPEGLRYSYARAARQWGFRFVQENLLEIDLKNRRVKTQNNSHAGDGLLITLGVETNYFNLQDIRRHALPLRCVADATRIVERLKGDVRTAVVCGGGYTGVELATALWRWARTNEKPLRILLVELAPSLCALLPQPFQDYVMREVCNLGIEVRTETSVVSADERTVTLSNGERLEESMLLWTAGVCTDSTTGFGENQTGAHSCKFRFENR